MRLAGGGDGASYLRRPHAHARVDLPRRLRPVREHDVPAVQAARLRPPLSQRERVGALVYSAGDASEAVVRRRVAQGRPSLPPEDCKGADGEVQHRCGARGIEGSPLVRDVGRAPQVAVVCVASLRHALWQAPLMHRSDGAHARVDTHDRLAVAVEAEELAAAGRRLRPVGERGGAAVGGGVEARRVVLEECDGDEGVEHLLLGHRLEVAVREL
mmetsp:Transcript_46492/g.151025  ORF Transcript_46492/g.151025 Transcript_46492/m.151025 type:complete len:214 (+) Transcript_46492:1013-1654(+)